MGSVVVAFSGGVDSAYLAVRAHQLLGTRTLAVTAESASLAEVQRSQAARLAADFGFAHRFLPTAELDDARYVQNTPDRCYHCKAELFRWLIPLAQAEGYAHVAYGLIAPTTSATSGQGIRRPWKPGSGATGRCRPDQSGDPDPLAALGLSTWDLPASPVWPPASPTAFRSRSEVLGRVEAAEARVRSFGFREFGSATGAHGVG